MITSWTSAHRNIGYAPIGPVAVLLLLAQVTRAAAQSPPAPAAVRVHLTVDADARCATPAAVAEQVHERSQRIVFVTDMNDVPRLRVTIGATGARDRVAQLSVQWPDGRRSERRLTAGSCASALDALALLVAMTLDPAALGERGEVGSPLPAPAGGAAAQRTGEQPQSAQPQSAQPQSAQPQSVPPTGDAAPAPAARAPRDAVPARHAGAPHPLGVEHVAAGATAQLVSGPAPRTMPGFGLYALLALNGAGPWAPALELQLARTWVYGLSEAGGDADFELEVARLDACPLGARWQAFSARACMAAAIGRLIASGSNSYAPQTHREPWASLGGTLLLSVGLGTLAELQAGFGLARPLRRYRFAFRPDVFHRVPALSWAGHLGAGVRFP